MTAGFSDYHAQGEIRQVMARYVQGVDRRDAALIRSCYHADAYEVHHIFNGNAHAFAEWRARQTFRSHHVLSESAIRFEGDRAFVETPHVAVVHVDIATPEARGVIELRTSGWYLDLFTREDGAWRIKHRHVSTFELSERLIDPAAMIDPAESERLASLGFDIGSAAPPPSAVADVAEATRQRFLARLSGPLVKAS